MSNPLFEMGVWIVDDHCDSAKLRTKKNVDRDNAFRAKWSAHYKPLTQFPTEREAWAFVVERAKRKIAVHELQLKKDKARLRKLEKRLAAIA